MNVGEQDMSIMEADLNLHYVRAGVCLARHRHRPGNSPTWLALVGWNMAQRPHIHISSDDLKILYCTDAFLKRHAESNSFLSSIMHCLWHASTSEMLLLFKSEANFLLLTSGHLCSPWRPSLLPFSFICKDQIPNHRGLSLGERMEITFFFSSFLSALEKFSPWWI